MCLCSPLDLATLSLFTSLWLSSLIFLLEPIFLRTFSSFISALNVGLVEIILKYEFWHSESWSRTSKERGFLPPVFYSILLLIQRSKSPHLVSSSLCSVLILFHWPSSSNNRILPMSNVHKLYHKETYQTPNNQIRIKILNPSLWGAWLIEFKNVSWPVADKTFELWT